MRKLSYSLVLLSISLVIILVGLGCRGLGVSPEIVEPPPQPPQGNLSRIEHVLFMFQENRSFDHYFSELNRYRAERGLPQDVDVAPRDATNPPFNSVGEPISRFRMISVCHENVSPSWNESHIQMSLGFIHRPPAEVARPYPMNGFVQTAAGYANSNNLNEREGRRAMGYYDEGHIPYYYWLATEFAISDRFFSAIPANSPPNRVFTLGATSEGFTYSPDRPMVGKNIFDLLQEKGVSWKVYVTDIRSDGPVTFLRRYPAFFAAHADKIRPLDEYFADLNAGTLPAVALIESGYTSGLDEHPNNNIQLGVAHVARILNALMNSSAWEKSVFFLTYDEAGGLYDHVPPPDAVVPDNHPIKYRDENAIQAGLDHYGLRMPFFVVSPFAKRAYVGHTVMDQTAILKFIETRFGLPHLTERDRSQPPMDEFFDFSQVRTNIPAPPEQPTDAPCYHNAVP